MQIITKWKFTIKCTANYLLQKIANKNLLLIKANFQKPNLKFKVVNGIYYL